MSEISNHKSSLNPQHPMKGNDAFLVVEYSAYVAPPDSGMHPEPFIKNQPCKSYISSKKSDKVVVSGAQGTDFDGIVTLLVSIDGTEAVSIGEVKSGWDTWIHITISFGIRCDDQSHEIKILVKQFVKWRLMQPWLEILNEKCELKFTKPTEKKEEETIKKKGGRLAKIKKAVLHRDVTKKT